MMELILAVLGPVWIDGVHSSQSQNVRVPAWVRSIVEFHLDLGECNHSDCTLNVLDNRHSIF